MSLARTCSVPFFLPILFRVAPILPSMLLSDWPDEGRGRLAHRRAHPKRHAARAARRTTAGQTTTRAGKHLQKRFQMPQAITGAIAPGALQAHLETVNRFRRYWRAPCDPPPSAV